MSTQTNTTTSTKPAPAATTTAPGGRVRPMRILSLGLPRTGTASLSQALTMLGCENVHHGMKLSYDSPQFTFFREAFDRSFPCLPTYIPGRPMTRADWDSALSEYDAVTDMGGIFGPLLIEAYPEAQVVLVGRGFDAWYRSAVEECVGVCWSPMGCFVHDWVSYYAGNDIIPMARRLVLAMFGVSRPEDINKEMARAGYEAHYERVRRAAEGRVLEYNLGTGWGPLCEFLGKEVPVDEGGKELEFPHLNDAESFRRTIWSWEVTMMKKLTRRAGPWIVGLGAVVCGVLWVRDMN